MADEVVRTWENQGIIVHREDFPAKELDTIDSCNASALSAFIKLAGESSECAVHTSHNSSVRVSWQTDADDILHGKKGRCCMASDMKPVKNAEPEDMEIIRPLNEPVTGIHYIFWNPPEGVTDTFDEYEFRTTFDIYWSSKAADAAMRRYKRDGISVHRIDYPLKKLDQTSREGLSLLAQLPTEEGNTIWYLCLRHVFAERRWQHWLNEGQPEESKPSPERKV